MEAELAGLAASGATTLVGLMVSDAWAQTRERVARFFAREGDGSAEVNELQRSQVELLAARESGDIEAATDVEAEWRTRLRRLLRSDPAAADELRFLLAELGPMTPAGPTSVVYNSFNGGVQHGTFFQGQDFSSMTFQAAGAPPLLPPPPPPPATGPAPDDRQLN